MESLQSEDGQHFIRSLATFIRQHEKALANSLQLAVHRRQPSANSSSTSLNNVTSGTTPSSNSSSSLAAALSFAGLSFKSHTIKSALLTLTPHHLYYLLSRAEDLGISVGPMSVRLENVISESSPTNYVSFLQTRQGPGKGRSDKDSIHSVSSVRSVMSSMTTFWASVGLGGSGSAKSERAKAAAEADLKYLYSAFTKLPSLRLTSDHRARLIKGYEEFPFDTAVPLFAFKNLQQLDIVDLDFRQFCGWDRLAEQLTLLTVKRGHVEDPAELLTDIVLDDAEKRRRRSAKGGRQASPTPTSSWTVPSTPRADYAHSHSGSASPPDIPELSADPHHPATGSPARAQRSHNGPPTPGRPRYSFTSVNRPRHAAQGSHSNNRPRHGTQSGASAGQGRYSTGVLELGDDSVNQDSDLTLTSGTPPKNQEVDGDTDVIIAGSISPKRPNTSRPASSYRHVRAYSGYSSKYGRSGSGSSTSSDTFRRSESASNLLEMDYSLPSTKWQRLKYLSLADNSLTCLSPHSLAPVASTLKSLSLASNLFTEIPDSLAYLTRLVSLDLSNCMIDSLQSLTRSPLPAITTLKLKSNRLQSLAGVERLLSLENLNVQDNKLTDPTEAARLTGLPNFRKVWLKHNPLTKTYAGWRVTIFNLFRTTPGYVEDIVIDDSGPGFSERKQLSERVPEVEPKLSQATVRIVDPPVIIQSQERPRLASAEVPEISRTPSYRRKKAPRRRIVDLAQEDSPGRSQSASVIATRHSLESNRQERTRVGGSGVEKRSRGSISRLEDAVAQLSPDANADSQDDYRAKIEALRREFGSNWLSQLGEQGWPDNHQIEMQPGEVLAPPTLHRANTAITSGGRTLG